MGIWQAGWYADPSGRHQHRYWNGKSWTEYVGDQGAQSLNYLSSSLLRRVPPPLASVTHYFGDGWLKATAGIRKAIDTHGRGWRKWALVGAGVFITLLLVGGVVGALSGADDDSSSASPGPSTVSVTVTVTTPPSTTPAVEPSTPAFSTSAPGRTRTAPPTHRPSAVLGVLSAIAVKGRAPTTGYDRDLFGSAWTDDNANPYGHNGCDTRNDILQRDLENPVVEAGTNGCVVLRGILNDPYTGAQIRFVRGEATSGLVQIDHVVALGDAWQTGAQQWSAVKRQDFANDPLNLLAVQGAANESKGDGDAATWLPPSHAFRCRYVARQAAVKAKYGLWMTAAERDASRRILAGCQTLDPPTEPGRIHPRSAVRIYQPPPPPTTPPHTTPHTSAPGGGCMPGYSPCLPIRGDIDCGEISDALKPIRVTGSDPYGLDADGDGYGCDV